MSKQSKKIKLGKMRELIFNDDCICIDSILMIKKEYIEFEDIILQSMIDNNKPFFYKIAKKTLNKNVPNLASLINRDWQDLELLEDTELILDRKVKHKIFHSISNNDFTYINNFYYDIIKQCIPEFNILKSKGEYDPLVIANKNLEPIGVVMPIIALDCFLHKLIKEQK